MSASLSCKDYLPFSPLDHYHSPGVHGKQTHIYKYLESYTLQVFIQICKLQPLYHFLSLTYKDLPYTRHVTGAGLAKETDLYFLAVVERGTGKFYRSRTNY